MPSYTAPEIDTKFNLDEIIRFMQEKEVPRGSGVDRRKNVYAQKIASLNLEKTEIDAWITQDTASRNNVRPNTVQSAVQYQAMPDGSLPMNLKDDFKAKWKEWGRVFGVAEQEEQDRVENELQALENVACDIDEEAMYAYIDRLEAADDVKMSRGKGWKTHWHR